MRVLALNYEFPPLGGGAANATAHICRELVQLGCTVEVLTSGFSGLPKLEELDGYRVRRVPVVRRKTHQSSPLEMVTFVASALIPALRLSRSFKPDIVHAYFAMPTGLIALALKTFTGAPYLLSLRGGDVPGFLPETLGTFHRLTGPFAKPVWGRAGAIVANSQGLQELAQRSSPIHVELAPNGIDLEFYRPLATPRNDGVYRILFVGRLVEQKGLRYLLDALPGLRTQAQQPVELVVVGDGPARPALEEQVSALGLEASVCFAGWAQRAEMPGHYQSADVFALPSFEEGMPNVVLEAMASGLPIVTTDIYGNRELVVHEENGLLFPPASVQALEAALLRLLREPEARRGMGNRSRTRAQDYGWGRTAQTYWELSQRVIAKRREGQVAAGV